MEEKTYSLESQIEELKAKDTERSEQILKMTEMIKVDHFPFVDGIVFFVFAKLV